MSDFKPKFDVNKDIIKDLALAHYGIRYDEKTSGVRLWNNLGVELTPTELVELAKSIMNAVHYMEQSGVDFEMEAERKRQEIAYRRTSNPRKKAFRTDLKRHWSFACAECGERISSKQGGHYYYYSDYVSDDSPYFCSANCVTNTLKSKYPLLEITVK